MSSLLVCSETTVGCLDNLKHARSLGISDVSTDDNPTRFFIRVNRRPGFDQDILIPIARMPEIELTERNLPQIFEIVNTHSVNIPYAYRNDFEMFYKCGLSRQLHNGTHSARQVRCIEALFDLVRKRGSENSKKHLASFSEHEVLNIKLAAYFLRTGRVDEESHKSGDDYYQRSALIYEAYARQLRIQEPTIQWTKMLINHSCKPITLENPRDQFTHQLLSTSHNLDLVRCSSVKEYEGVMKKVRESLERLGIDPLATLEPLKNFAIALCQATGSKLYYTRGGNKELFEECSKHGTFCWEAVQKTAIPDWEHHA